MRVRLCGSVSVDASTRFPHGQNNAAAFAQSFATTLLLPRRCTSLCERALCVYLQVLSTGVHCLFPRLRSTRFAPLHFHAPLAVATPRKATSNRRSFYCAKLWSDTHTSWFVHAACLPFAYQPHLPLASARICLHTRTCAQRVVQAHPAPLSKLPHGCHSVHVQGRMGVRSSTVQSWRHNVGASTASVVSHVSTASGAWPQAAFNMEDTVVEDEALMPTAELEMYQIFDTVQVMPRYLVHVLLRS